MIGQLITAAAALLLILIVAGGIPRIRRNRRAAPPGFTEADVAERIKPWMGPNFHGLTLAPTDKPDSAD
jgi:hypothetical protein